MFGRPQKEASPSRSARHKLEAWTRTPSVDDIRLMMGEASGKRGVLVEVIIKRPDPPAFILTCQWEPKGEAPVWSLYEGEDGSKTCWTYPNGNVDMIYEIICMSLPGGVNSSAPSTLGGGALAPSIPASNDEEEPAKGAAPPAQAPAAAPNPAQQAQQQPMPGTAMPPQGAPYMQPGQPYPPGVPYPPGQPYPQAMPPAGYPVGYPQAPYPQQAPYPGYPQPGPQGYPPQGMPPGGWGQPGYPAQPPYPLPQGYPPPAPGFPSMPGNDNPALQPVDLGPLAELINKGENKLLLGHLFVEAGILPEPCVEAALKLQELTRKSLLSKSAAVEALRKAAERGGILDDDLIEACRQKYPHDAIAASAPVSKQPTGQVDAREFARQVVTLICQSGIVTENDVATAEGVRKKHGGEVGNILVAAGKIEKATLDAAKRCQPLVREHRLNNEEAFRILRHCQKTKASVDDAFRDLSIRVL